MSEDDRQYFRFRAEQELKAVGEANNSAAASVHKAMAARYSLLADQGDPSQPLAASEVAPPE